MKTAIRISIRMFMIIFLLSNLNAFSLQNPPEGGSDVQFIAVHFGNVDHASVMDKAEFPDFKYYSATGTAFSYSEKQKIIGNPKNLVGYYGEVPEKMGFGANYTEKKYFSAPYSYGLIYVIDQNGIISYQSPNTAYYPNVPESEYANVKSIVKKLKKGKATKVLASKKCKYLKKSAVGELETLSGSKIDKDSKGLVGWEVPDINVIDENGNNKSLKDITKDKISIVVFYSLNGVGRKFGDAKGNIIEEWQGGKLLSTGDYAKNKESKFMEGDYDNKADAKKAFGKSMFKSAVVGTTLGNLFNSKEEIDDAGRAAQYSANVSRIKMVQSISKNLKKK